MSLIRCRCGYEVEGSYDYVLSSYEEHRCSRKEDTSAWNIGTWVSIGIYFIAVFMILGAIIFSLYSGGRW